MERSQPLDIQSLQARLEEAETVLEALHVGGADALVVSGAQGWQVFTRQGADQPYRTLVEVLSEGAALLSPGGMILHCNQRFAELLGLSVEQALGASMRTFVPAIELHRLEATLDQIDCRRTVELTIQAANGRFIPVFLSLNRLHLAETQVVCLVATDLTEQKRQEGVIAAQQLSRSILDQSAEAIFVCDQQGVVTRCSQRALLLCEQNPVGRLFDDVLPLEVTLSADFASYGDPNERFSVTRPLGGELFQGRLGRHHRRNGIRVDVLLSASPLTRDNGEVHGCVITLTDITERKRATEALEELRRRNELILEALGEGVCGLDRVGRITFVNPAACMLLGREARELLGQSVHQLVHGPSADRLHAEAECPLLQVYRHRRAVRGTDEQFWRKDGRTFPVTFVTTPLQEGNELVGAVMVFADVSEQLRAERELRAAIGRLNSTLTSITDCSLVLGADWRVEEINAAAAAAFGRTPEDLVGQGFWETFPELLETAFGRECHRAMHEQRPIHVEGELLAHVWFETHVYPRAGRLEVFFKDISERKRHEAELATLRDELAAQVQDLTRLQTLGSRLLNETPPRALLGDVLRDAVARQGADMGELRLCTPGQQPFEVVAQAGEPIEGLVALAASSAITTFHELAIQSRRRVVVADLSAPEGRVVQEGREARQALAMAGGVRAAQATPLFGASGEPLGVLSTFFRGPRAFSEWELRLLDLYGDQAAKVIERGRAEEALRQSEREFRAMFDLAGVGKFQADVETGRLLRVNRKLCEITGYPADELLEMSILDLTHPADRSESLHEVMRVEAGERGEYTTERRYIRKDRRLVWVRVTGTVIRDAEGRPVQSIAVIEDITQRKAAEEELSRLYLEARCREAELRDKQEQLVQAGKLATLGEMATGIAHELNNPLNNIGLFLGNVLDQLEIGRLDPDRIAQNVRDSLLQVRKASEIISHLRVFGRGETLSLKPCAIHRVIHDALSLLGQQLRLRQIQVELALVGQPLVLGNAIQLEQVFINLVTNARDALAGVGAPQITIRSRSGVDWVEVQVEDNGPGIPAGLERRIFDPFFTTKEVGHGTGLGLSISYSIIKAHQGSITVMSPPGSGARFCVRLPLAPQEVQQDILP